MGFNSGFKWLKLRSDSEIFNQELRLDGFVNAYLLRTSWFL